MSEIRETIQPDSAGQFLDILARRNPIWGPNPSDWIFRGHADSTWGLTPTAMREDVVLGLGPNAPIGPRNDYESQVRAEAKLIVEFLEAVDREGLPVPAAPYSVWSDTRETIQGAIERASGGHQKWPPDHLRGLVALAKHYGIPSRLLDWTQDSFIAAYFAASDAAEGNSSGKDSSTSESLAVWAYRLKAIPDIFRRGQIKVDIIRVPRASNRRLHAQKGLFTLVEFRRVKGDGPATHAPLDDLLLDHIEEHDPERSLFRYKSLPMFRKIELPKSQAGCLLRLLSVEGVDGGSVFPGYPGAARMVEERQLWDKGDRHIG